MKNKKILIILGAVLLIAILVIIFLNMNKVTYSIKVEKVDNQSPDRILTVYNEKNEKVEVKKIEYLDGTLLCNGYNTTVHYGDIKEEKVFKVILKDKTEVRAKIVDEEVK